LAAPPSAWRETPEPYSGALRQATGLSGRVANRLGLLNGGHPDASAPPAAPAENHRSPAPRRRLLHPRRRPGRRRRAGEASHPRGRPRRRRGDRPRRSGRADPLPGRRPAGGARPGDPRRPAHPALPRDHSPAPRLRARRRRGELHPAVRHRGHHHRDAGDLVVPGRQHRRRQNRPQERYRVHRERRGAGRARGARQRRAGLRGLRHRGAGVPLGRLQGREPEGQGSGDAQQRTG
jgi:hypothetical protein